MSRLTIAQQQMTEIAKALSHDVKVLVLDEPTSALAESETEELFRVLRDLRGNGVAIVYISHAIEEILDALRPRRGHARRRAGRRARRSPTPPPTSSSG